MMNRTHAPRINILRLYALCAAGLLAVAAAAPANAASRDEQSKACRGDAMHFCAAEIPNEDKITACMKQHVDELSPACRAMFKGGKKSGAKDSAQ
ncbi:hypothetical protein [Paraburkholderia bryophila]|jgi:hypothetical protein|uniref:Cysteine rich repeat protein n=1 Tax=Paraburkholderia bryophila TaxID=420952 RepID=A0A329BRJ8_9BURK|nr:hypothetical protein BX591_117109 [Paraburkholderia bryophila]